MLASLKITTTHKHNPAGRKSCMKNALLKNLKIAKNVIFVDVM